MVRYLVGAKRIVWKYGEKEDGDDRVWVDVFVDSGWASGCEGTSTSGGMMCVGRTCAPEDGNGYRERSRPPHEIRDT